MQSSIVFIIIIGCQDTVKQTKIHLLNRTLTNKGNSSALLLLARDDDDDLLKCYTGLYAGPNCCQSNMFWGMHGCLTVKPVYKL